MKTILFTLSLLTVSCSFTFGQIGSDSIKMKRVFGGYQFYRSDERLTVNKLVRAMKSNEVAYQQMKLARKANTFASIFGFAGGALIGWPIGTGLAGGEPNWALAGIGAGLILIALPIDHSFQKKVKSAVALYNQGLQSASRWPRPQLKFGIRPNAFVLRLKL